MTRCDKCGINYVENYEYCLHCGKNIVPESELPTLKIVTDKTKPKAMSQSKGQPSNVINFDRSSNKGIVANQLTIKTTKKSVKLNPPSDIIASDANMRAYTKYLIDRYHEFKKGDWNIGEMRYPAIYAAIKKEFKCSWDYVPISRFSDLVIYLHKRIDNTIIGKNQKKQGKRRYEMFEEWLTTR